MLEDLFSFISIDAFHRLAFFLGTNEGTLFKRAVELVIFTILAYMVISEYLQKPKPELKFFIIAFLAVMAHSALIVYVNANVVFGTLTVESLRPYLPVTLSMLEALTVLLLAMAFLYPMIKGRVKAYLPVFVLLIVAIAVVIEGFWLLTPEPLFEKFWGNVVFIIMELIILTASLCLLAAKAPRFRYHRHIYIAFSMYLMSPLLHLLNILLFNNESLRMRLVEHVFPFLSFIIFTQVTYRKLVDKAYLKELLRISETKYQQEKELGKLKDEFVSTVSHELRTPLTSILLYLGLLKGKKFGGVNKKQSDALCIVEEESRRLAAMINDILNLSKMESGKQDINLALFDLHELNSPIYYEAAKVKGLKVSFRIAEGFVVKVDIDKFKQVFTNLVSNAIKYTDVGTITITATKNHDSWNLSVRDTGKGIPSDKIPNLFDKFYQIDSHMTREQGGVGLGLAIAKMIVDMHKGRIDVNSEVGRGSEFRVVMPKKINV